MLVSEKAPTLKTTKIKSKLLLGRKPLQNKNKYLAGTAHQAIKISKLGLILILIASLQKNKANTQGNFRRMGTTRESCATMGWEANGYIGMIRQRRTAVGFTLRYWWFKTFGSSLSPTFIGLHW